ncbi:MAG: DNA methyltransferase [Chloroflexi bacterium]|nr:DNA methyltransferase [Chloroflexota bacterium]
MNNRLFYGDNLEILRSREYFPDECVDLIYLDPPFNSNRNYNVLFKSESGADSEAQITAFEDTWHWGETAEDTYHDLIVNAPEKVSTAIEALLNLIDRNQMMAYLVMMTARLVELRRVLKPTGSLYLHCDDSASHYLKIVLDAIFSPTQFRNHITWRRATAHNDPKRYGRIQDHILYYAKGDNPIWNGHDIATPKSDEQLAAAYPSGDERGRYRSADLSGPLHNSTYGSPSTLPWRRYDVFAMGRCWSVPKTGKYAEYIEKNFIPNYRSIEGIHDRLEALDAAGLIHHPEKGKWPGLKRYEDADTGIAPQNIILDPIGFTNYSSQRGEKLGFETQKPLALLEKFILASSNEGDIVLDPFCGCGTAIAAAHKLNRRWIGIDITHLSIALQKYRLQDMFGLASGVDYEVIGEPTTVDAARTLAQDSDNEGRYQFEWWALSLVGAKPVGGQAGSRKGKKGADKGIDGVINFFEPSEKGRPKPKKVIVQVKSGAVKSGDIRDLKGTVEREKAAIGVFITLELPTQAMLKEALAAGYYESDFWNKTYRKLQILSIRDLLGGDGVDMPPQHGTFKQAQRQGATDGKAQRDLM